MSSLPSAVLLDPPPFPAGRYAVLADRLKRLLATEGDVVFVQGEAIVALEAAATSLARPGLTALNIVTSPYGAWFGVWLRRGGASVRDVVAEPGQPVTVEAVEAALGRGAVDVLAIVHGEAASGLLNPLSAIADLARAHGALTVVDAVASVGAHPLAVDALGLDIVVIGPQKALRGPAGVSALGISARAWERIAAPGALATSTLSLLDLRQNWLNQGRGAIPGTPVPLEFWALDAALDRVEAEGLEAVIARHARAARASRAGLRALGMEPWIADDAAASALVTAAPVPPGVEAEALVAAAAALGVPLGHGFGDIRGRLVRLDHTGARAAFTPVLANVVAYGTALLAMGQAVDIGAAAAAVGAAYGER